MHACLPHIHVVYYSPFLCQLTFNWLSCFCAFDLFPSERASSPATPRYLHHSQSVAFLLQHLSCLQRVHRIRRLRSPSSPVSGVRRLPSPESVVSRLGSPSSPVSAATPLGASSHCRRPRAGRYRAHIRRLTRPSRAARPCHAATVACTRHSAVSPACSLQQAPVQSPGARADSKRLAFA